MRNIISILINDKFGALSRIIELFSSRGYNLASICSGTCEIPDTQRLTLVVKEDADRIKKIVAILNGYIDVVSAEIVDPTTSYSREMMLVKLKYSQSNRAELVNEIKLKNGAIIDATANRMSFEVHGSAEHLDDLIDTFRKYGVVELARTGEAAIHR